MPHMSPDTLFTPRTTDSRLLKISRISGALQTSPSPAFRVLNYLGLGAERKFDGAVNQKEGFRVR